MGSAHSWPPCGSRSVPPLKALHVSAAACSVIHEHSIAAYPREACGLLIGAAGANSPVLRALSCRNRAEEPNRFELHPEDFLAAEMEASASGLAVIGVWHSHPDQPAVPSEVDRVDAYHAWVHLICSVDAGEVRSLRSWRLVKGHFTEQAVTAGTLTR